MSGAASIAKYLVYIKKYFLCRVVFCPGWRVSQLEAASLGLVPVVHSRQDNLPPRPLLVLDRCGGTEAAAFCALSSLIR